MANEVKDGSCFCYAVIGNIPPFYHSSDLRNYFSQFLESGGFECFHFRHRPEIQKEKNKDKYSEKKLTETQSKNEIADTNSAQKSFDLTQFCKVWTSEISANTTASRNTMCCVVKLTPINRLKLISMYHRKHWLNRKGESIRSLCRIDPVQLPDKDTIADKFKTRHESKTIASDRETFTQADLDGLIELKPPDIMPHGNVGTPTQIFLDLINKCLLPPIVIKKLGLTFPKTRTNKRYGNVPFDYGGDVEDTSQNDTIEEDVKTAQGHLITGENEEKEHDRLLSNMSKREREKLEKDETKKLKAKNIEEDMIPECNSSGEDDDTCEEWERHEALHDDPSNAERNKERLFEEKIELKWEKGGSGLVFYTDAQYWAKEEGDFDEQTADDWDVDMSVYYDPTGGDKDARDHVTMRREKRRREGLQDEDESVGKFEQFTKGVGRKVLEKQGWREGAGLGGSRIGISTALEGEGQKPRDKSGLGYHGEKLSRNVKKKRAERDVIISTSYDEPRDNDPLEPLLRRSEPYTLKYRDSVLFNKSTDPT